MRKRREKLKVVEVLSLHCLDREPRPGAQNNRWVAEVMLEPPAQAARNGVTSLRRTVTILAKDELEAFIKLLTEGA